MIEEFYNYSKISWEYLNKIWDLMNFEKMLIGGWAVHLLVNEKLKEIKRKEYIGSKDIDIFIFEENLNDLKNILSNLGFKEEDKRFYIKVNDFKLYVDILTEKSELDPVIRKAFLENKKIKVDKFFIPYSEFLIVSKIWIFQIRGLKEKRIKDLLDLIMLLSFTRYDISIIKELIRKFRLFPEIIVNEFDAVEDLLGYFDFSKEEINSLKKILVNIKN